MPKITRPRGAVGSVTYSTDDGGVRRAVDSRGNQWYLNQHDTWTRRARVSVPLYNRFRPSVAGRGGVRAASFASRVGSAAAYFPAPALALAGQKIISGAVTHFKRKKRTYAAAMRAATAAEGLITTNSATAYARHFLPHSTVAYNWCHLLGHGAGGSDDPDNIVAGSTHCNSEQLEIESVLYQFRSRGVTAHVAADLENGSLHLARRITYTVKMNGSAIWIRTIDAHRTRFPTYTELQGVRGRLLAAITSHLPRWR